MRKTLLLTFICGLLIAFGTSFTFKQSEKKFLQKKGFEFVPSGTTTIDGESVSIQGFYMLESEVSNLAYREFLNDLEKNGKTEALAIAAVAADKWLLPNMQMDVMVENYHTNVAYNAYPVVNISQEGARLYCRWLEEKFAEQGYSLKVRIPERAEWIYADKGGNETDMYAWEGNSLRNKKGAYLANFKTEKTGDDGGYITAITKSYFPNAFGLYNMCGNVSEWVNDTAMSQGGNWWSDAEFLKIATKQEFGNSTGPSPFIGFRPVITATVY